MNIPALTGRSVSRPRGIALLLALVLLFAGLTPFSRGQEVPALRFDPVRDPVRIQADQVSYDHKEDAYAAEGKVEIFQGNRKLSADRVTLSGKTNEVEASGNVILVQGDDVLRSERIKVDLDTSLGIIVRGTLFLQKQHFYLRGEEIERIGEETYRIRRGSLTTCDGDWPSWRFTSEEIVVTVEGFASASGATFEIKNVPVLYSPYLVFPVKTQRQSGLLIPRTTFSNLSGVTLETAYYWAIAKNMDATFFLDLATKKGIGEGLEYRYVRKQDSFGQFYAYHLREKQEYRDERTEQLDRKPDRWQVDFRHEEYRDASFFAKTRLQALSDRQYLKDFGDTYEERSSEQLPSFLSLTKNWESVSLYGEALHTVDLRRSDPTTLQNYPVVNFTGLRKQISGSPLYYSFNSGAGYFWREEGETGVQADLHPRLSVPLRLSFLEVTPEVGGRATFYSVRNGREETESRQSWDFKTTVATEMYRVFETSFAGLSKIKHWIRPEITYSYLPDTDQFLIPFKYLSYYDPITPKRNALTFGISQRLIGKISEKDGKSRYEELLYLKLSESYDISEANRDLSAGSPPRRPFGPLVGELRINFLQYVTAENVTSYDPNINRFLSSYTLFMLKDARGDSLNLEYSWVNGVQDQINTWLRVRLHPSLDALYGKRYSRQENKSLETFYGAQYRHQCWTVDLSYSEKPAIAGQPAERKFLFAINLLGVTSMGAR